MTKLAAYHKRRRTEALARWKEVADMRAQGMKQKEIAAIIGTCQSRVHYLEQKWHAHRISTAQRAMQEARRPSSLIR